MQSKNTERQIYFNVFVLREASGSVVALSIHVTVVGIGGAFIYILTRYTISTVSPIASASVASTVCFPGTCYFDGFKSKSKCNCKIKPLKQLLHLLYTSYPQLEMSSCCGRFSIPEHKQRYRSGVWKSYLPTQRLWQSKVKMKHRHHPENHKPIRVPEISSSSVWTFKQGANRESVQGFTSNYSPLAVEHPIIKNKQQ